VHHGEERRLGRIQHACAAARRERPRHRRHPRGDAAPQSARKVQSAAKCV
jgi:hypothetical protein